MDTLIFLHIPKAAGSTLRPILEGFFGDDEVFVIKDDIPGYRKQLFDMVPEDKRRLRLVFGHACYGWHTAFPEDHDVRYATILRNPSERVYSLFNYIKRSPMHFLGDEVRNMSLIEFVESGVHNNVDNGMVRQLCGLDRFYNEHGEREPYNDAIIPYGEITHEHLEIARRNLADCCIVGTVPMFNDFLRGICRMLGHKIPWFEVRNKTPNGQKRPLTCEERIVIARYNRFDWELYMMAQGLANEIASRVWKQETVGI
jgi:hypothetical protein